MTTPNHDDGSNIGEVVYLVNATYSNEVVGICTDEAYAQRMVEDYCDRENCVPDVDVHIFKLPVNTLIDLHGEPCVPVIDSVRKLNKRKKNG